MDTAPPGDGPTPKSPDRSGPSLLLLPLALLVGAVVGLSTLGEHQEAVRPAATAHAHLAAHAPGTTEPWHAYGVQPAVKYLRVLAHHLHL
jgi:hypothetical protein